MLIEPDRGPKRPTQKTPGYGGFDLNITGMTSTKDCRKRATDRPVIRVRTKVGVTGGYTDPSLAPAQSTRKRGKKKGTLKPRRRRVMRHDGSIATL